MADQDLAERLYCDSVVVDGLNVSNWGSPTAYESLHAGGVALIDRGYSSNDVAKILGGNWRVSPGADFGAS